MRRKWMWAIMLALPLVIGGLVYAGMQANADLQSNDAGFTCPVTGETLPCPKCCPLN